ncbi:MAG: type I-E CRISPR-associated protein Cas5/CasD [Hyphomicrobiaceae bacterium]
MQVLLFTLHAPLVAYGDHGARTSRRSSWDRPTRTATLGLVAAALGIDRSDHEQHLALHEGLGFAVRVDATGRSLTDYHTFDVGKGAHLALARSRADELDGPTQTTITYREYRTDALHTVALWLTGDCPWTLDQIQAALRRPHWILYLGRRSCIPALPLKPTIVDAATIPAAFALHPPIPEQLAADLRLDLDCHPIIAADVGAPGVTPLRVEQRHDGYHHTRGDLRTFVERQEWVMPLLSGDTDHSAEAG